MFINTRVCLAKRRYNAKKIAQTPSLKKKMAAIIAKYDTKAYNLQEMLVYGHRGYISYHEDDVCKLFDQTYSAQIEKQEALIEQLETELKSARRWGLSMIEEKIKACKSVIQEFDDIANEIFEEKMLR